MAANSNKSALKASFFYVICAFLIKGINFITTPFFSRILTREEYGYISNFNSWLSVITIIASLSLIASLVRARFDYKQEYDSYISSILMLGVCSTIVCFLVILLNLDYFRNAFSLDTKYIILLGLSVLSQPAYDIFLQNQRFVYKYKFVTALTIAVTLSSVALSFLFIYLFDDNMWGRTLGGQLPVLVVALAIYLYYFSKSLKLKIEYCKYAVIISVPYIFHLLSSVVLGSSDRIMITMFCGTKDNAIYSMAYNIGMIVNILWAAFNQAFAPWLGEKLNEKDIQAVRKVATPYVAIFAVLVIGMLLVAPEALLVLGGKKYIDSLMLIPPVMMAYTFVFVDSLYVNVLQFEKHTLGMAIATITAATVNVVLNYLFIPRFGYVAAAYTTVAGYFVLLLIDYCLVKHINLDKLYDTKLICIVLIGLIGFSCTTLLLYKFNIARYIILAVYLVCLLYMAWKNKERIIKILK